MSRRRVVITGLGAITSLGDSTKSLWEGLCTGASGIVPIGRFDASPFSCHIGGELTNFDPTTYMGHARDVYHEGALIFPAVKVQEDYQDIDDIIRMCKMRIRVPEQWWGDYLAALGAARLVLHVGLGTFRPVTSEDPDEHEMEEERYEVSPDAAGTINAARASGGRVVAVGTTSVRVLETVADSDGRVHPGEGASRLFIKPPHDFRCVDVLLTNFHLPRSTLLMLVSAFAGREAVLAAYEEAIREGYRFYSYGDAMLLLP